MTQEEFDKLVKKELQPADTFQFSCDMCGNCCRNRDTPIMLSGPDVFRMARSLKMHPVQALDKYTRCYLGDESHLPVVVLKERDDGSCPLLRKGRCSIHKDKPAVCALYPLGRASDFYGNIHYFLQDVSCNNGEGQTWTLDEWLNEFSLRESEVLYKTWGPMLISIAQITTKMRPKEITIEVFAHMVDAMYANYDIGRDYIQQAEENKERLSNYFRGALHKNLKF